jgi:hypothetical protein
LPQLPRQYAIWSFAQLPTYSADPDEINFEFTFDIYRLTKGKEDQSVVANFTFADGRMSVPEMQKTLDLVQQERSKRQNEIMQQAEDKRKEGEPEQRVLDWKNTQLDKIKPDLIARFGVYELSEGVLDYHTQSLGGDDPEGRKRVAMELAQLFKSLKKKEQNAQAQDDRPAAPALNVFVSVDRQHASAAQKLGMARPDLYVLADSRPFWANFIKGIIGVWFTVMLILGIAVACSTYFSGIISLLVTVFLLLAGYSKDSFQELVQGKTSGPLEAAWHLFQKKAGAIRLDEGPAENLLRGGDAVYRSFVRLVLNLFPDINRFDLHPYVANGFDISWSQVLFLDNFVPLVGYVLPCAVLAFYLMRFREVANPT